MRSMGEVIADHTLDLWGVALVTVGLLAGVAFLVDSTAPASRVARVSVGDLLGWGRFLVPPVLITVGVLLLLLDRRDEDEDRWISPEPERVIIGAFLTLLAVAGLASLGGGSPHLTASTARLSSAGGWVGAVVGNPLRAGLGGFGSAVVLMALLVVAMVLFCGPRTGACHPMDRGGGR
jgi:S-DNA-T family DNA segregation ATPase FtsK/SpoIIIE